MGLLHATIQRMPKIQGFQRRPKDAGITSKTVEKPHSHPRLKKKKPHVAMGSGALRWDVPVHMNVCMP